MRPRRLLFGSLLLTSIWLALFGDKTPVSDDTPQQGSAHASALPTPAPRSTGPGEPFIMALQPRERLISLADTEDKTPLFRAHDWTPPPPPPKIKPGPPPRPTAPPLPFTYLGKKEENGQWEAFLARGDDVFVVREQTVIDGQYLVTSLTPQALTLTYLPLQQEHKLILGGAD
ncbi:hypothetical protein [Crenobacter luteus]|uniref:Secretion system X translation initiation factor n=1 Tax=Crenobacter luteus TaxID=1452487 RepID=A0A163C7H0_9NEIS|nr:hypothetical protein [Crenobacter luteus]KZE30296.1 hypothetical protein AVW16_12420 [Crenobacter luteus]